MPLGLFLLLGFVPSMVMASTFRMSPNTQFHGFKRLLMIVLGSTVPVIGPIAVWGASRLWQRHFSSRSLRGELDRREALVREGREAKRKGASDKLTMEYMVKRALELKVFRSSLLKSFEKVGFPMGKDMDEALALFDQKCDRRTEKEERQRKAQLARFDDRDRKRTADQLRTLLDPQRLNEQADMGLSEARELGKAIVEPKIPEGLFGGLSAAFSTKEGFLQGRRALDMDMLAEVYRSVGRQDLVNAALLSYAEACKVGAERTRIFEMLPDELQQKKSQEKPAEEKVETKAETRAEEKAESLQEELDRLRKENERLKRERAKSGARRKSESAGSTKKETVKETKDASTGKASRRVASKVNASSLVNSYNSAVPSGSRISTAAKSGTTSRWAKQSPAAPKQSESKARRKPAGRKIS